MGDDDHARVNLDVILRQDSDSSSSRNKFGLLVIDPRTPSNTRPPPWCLFRVSAACVHLLLTGVHCLRSSHQGRRFFCRPTVRTLAVFLITRPCSGTNGDFHPRKCSPDAIEPVQRCFPCGSYRLPFTDSLLCLCTRPHTCATFMHRPYATHRTGVSVCFCRSRRARAPTFREAAVAGETR